MSDFYKKILFKVIKPVLEHDHKRLRVKAKELKQADGESWAIGEMVQRVVNMMEFAELIFSDIPIEEWGEEGGDD